MKVNDFFRNRPSSKLKSKNITSQDDMVHIVGVEQSTPIASLPTTATSRSGAVKDDSSIASGSSGCGSLTKKKTNDIQTGELDPASFISSIVTDSGISESSEPTDSMSGSTNNQYSSQQQANILTQQQSLAAQGNNIGSANTEQGHSRNSSNTSQVSFP